MAQLNFADTLDADVTPDESLERLQSFCRGEMSAVETYEQAIEATSDKQIIAQLRRNQASHAGRVQLLRVRIRELGGEPPESSGPWGTFVKAVEGTASVIGEMPALSMLQEGEAHGLNDYRAEFSKLDLESQRLVVDEILPEQIQTHCVLASITRFLM